LSKIIAFSGKARSGKTTAANIIHDTWPEFTVISFATPIKQMAMAQFDLTKEDIEDKKKEIIIGDKQWTVRKLLQEIGRMYRAIDPDFWVKLLWKDADKILNAHKSIIIDDLRFKNEAKFLEAKGASLVRIERPGIELIDDVSEKDLDDYPFKNRIPNNSALENFHNMVVLYHALGLRTKD